MAGSTKSGDPLIGRVLAGKFEITALIGTGSMGRVYRAQHTALDKIIAVKILNDTGVRDPTVAARFKSEARAASRLDHPNSVQIFDFGEDEEVKLLYIAMELLDGTNLGDVVKREKRLTTARSAEIMFQVLAALGAAHRGGVIHRDLKPANIMLTKRHNDDGELSDFVKVCDFGIAKVLAVEGQGDATALALTRDGAVFGTPAFMSPEQARGEKVDARSDLFSCGVILYKMLSGTIPFRATTAPEMLAKLINGTPERITNHLPDLDPRIAEVIDKALAKDRDARFQTAPEMRAALKDAVGPAKNPVSVDEEKTIFDPREPVVDRTMPPRIERTRKPVAPAPPPRKSKLPLVLLVAAIAGLGLFAAFGLKKDPVTELAKLVGDRSYGIAENYYLDHYDALAARPEAAGLARQALRMRRDAENYSIPWDPSFKLTPSTWNGETTYEPNIALRKFVFVIDRVGDASFEGTLLWPARSIRASVHGIHDGNHLVWWDYELLDGKDAKQLSYVLLQKINMLIAANKMVATDAVPPDKLEAVKVE